MIFPSLLNIKKLWRVMCFSCELPEIGRHIYHHQLPLLLWLMMMLPSLLLLLPVCCWQSSSLPAQREQKEHIHSIFELL